MIAICYHAVGNSRNIVIDETRYREVAIQIVNPIEQESLMEFYSMKRDVYVK